MLYDLGFLIFSLFYLPALIFKGKMHEDFGERFGSYSKDKRDALAAAKDTIWIQAVSVGEVALCRAIIPLLKKRFPGSTIVLSTITKTGNDLAGKLFSKDALVIYFPLDLSSIVRKVVGLIRPKAYVMIETEIWPNVLKELSGRMVPAILVNGRISDRSFGKYMLVRMFLRKTLSRISAYCMQSRLDADRIIAMGAPADRVTVAGNMKLDILPSQGMRPAGEILASVGLKEGDVLFVAGSTHPGEESDVVEIYQHLLKSSPDLKLLIAPRHVERSGEVEKAVRSFGFEPVRVSKVSGAGAPYSGTRILILDTIGKLGEIYSAAAVVFIGGSLVRHGGQNPVEPAMFEKPVVFGPHMFNFKSIVTLLLDKDGAMQVTGKDDLLAKVSMLFRDPHRRSELGRNAKIAILENRGASQRCVDIITKLVNG